MPKKPEENKYIKNEDSVKRSIETATPYLKAQNIAARNPCFAGMFQNPAADSIHIAGKVLAKGAYDVVRPAQLANSYRQIDSFQPIRNVLGSTLMQPSVYTSPAVAFQPLITAFNTAAKPSMMQNITPGLGVMSAAMQAATRNTWLFSENTWTVAKSALSEIDVSRLAGTAAIEKLIRLEQQTSLIKSPVLESITSAATQIASIQEALGAKSYVASILDDYTTFAINQHLAIQKAADDRREIKWRLEALDAASKLVDRQVIWSKAMLQELSEAHIQSVEDDGLPSVIALLPSHIAYSKRNNVEISPEEALEQSKLLEITEKGKRIAENIVLMNRMRQDKGQSDIFKYTHKTVEGVIKISTVVCATNDQLGSIIDVLYFIFYENLGRIKTLVGSGDHEKGDKTVRTEEIYQCIFRVKDIRSDFRHDLDHGKEKDIQKKLKAIGDCYSHYCRRRPVQAKDYNLLQLRLYDEILLLEEALIDRLAEET